MQPTTTKLPNTALTQSHVTFARPPSAIWADTAWDQSKNWPRDDRSLSTAKFIHGEDSKVYAECREKVIYDVEGNFNSGAEGTKLGEFMADIVQKMGVAGRVKHHETLAPLFCDRIYDLMNQQTGWMVRLVDPEDKWANPVHRQLVLTIQSYQEAVVQYNTRLGQEKSLQNCKTERDNWAQNLETAWNHCFIYLWNDAKKCTYDTGGLHELMEACSNMQRGKAADTAERKLKDAAGFARS